MRNSGIFLMILLACFAVTCGAFAEDVGAKDNGIKFSGDLRWSPDAEMLTASNGISAEYQGITITADKAEVSLKTNIAKFYGNVKLANDRGAVYGDELTYNIRTKDWSFGNGRSSLLPALFDNMLASPVYVRGKEIVSEGGMIEVTSGSMTTCSLDHPHYYFSVKKMTIYPGSRIIAHDVSMFVLDKRLLTLGTLVIPIKGADTAIVPQVGSSLDEGLFMKLAYAYIATDTQTGVLKLDLMTRKGIGVGADHSYRASNVNGNVSLYYLNDRSIGGTNITGSMKHRQRIGDVDVNFTTNYRQNSYLFFPATTSQDTQLLLNRGNASSNSSLSMQSSSTRGSGESRDLAISFRQMQQLNKTLSATLSMDMRSNNSTGMTAADQELQTDLNLMQRTDKYDLTLSANKRIDLDGSKFVGDNQFSGLDKLPELTYETDSFRSGKRSLFGLPYRLSISAGHYHEMPTDVSKGRLYMRLDVLDKSFDLGARNQLNLSGGYSQAFYANDMAQYVLKFNSTLTTRYGDYLKSRLSWNYQRPEGYSPFRFDYTGKYNYTRAAFDYQNSDKLRWSLSSGYQLNRTDFPWQDIALKLTAHPDSRFSYALSAGYDLNRGQWRTLASQVRISMPRKINFDLGTRYDMERGRVDLMRGTFDIYAMKKWRLEGIASWNGASGAFDYRALRITRDLHCWEASITFSDETGFRQDRGISLDFRIKALPREDRFGIGQFGQLVDTSVGEYFY